MRFGSILILICIIGVSGCARWEPEKKPSKIFPKSRIALDAVGLEVGLAQLDSGQSETLETFMATLDHQALPLELRKLLDQNGLRAAIMPSHAPAIFNELVEPKRVIEEELTKLEKQLHSKGLLRERKRMISHERISNREGEVHAIPVSELHPQISWVIRNGNKETPGFGDSVRGVMTVTTYPLGDGSVRLVFEPEIHHGKEIPQIADRSFLKEARQSSMRIQDLKFEVTLRPGESIVITPTKTLAGMGELLFGTTNANVEVLGPKNRPTPTHRMLLVRIVQTQMDDLFGNTELVEKLSTTSRH